MDRSDIPGSRFRVDFCYGRTLFPLRALLRGPTSNRRSKQVSCLATECVHHICAVGYGDRCESGLLNECRFTMACSGFLPRVEFASG